MVKMSPFLMMRIETVETVSRNLSCSDHRAKAAVRMRRFPANADLIFSRAGENETSPDFLRQAIRNKRSEQSS